MPHVLDLILQWDTAGRGDVDEEVLSVARKATVLDADNVAAWYSEQLGTKINVREFDRCVPPFAAVSVEYQFTNPTRPGEQRAISILVWRVPDPDGGWHLFATHFVSDLRVWVGHLPFLLDVHLTREGIPQWEGANLVNTRAAKGDTDALVLEKEEAEVFFNAFSIALLSFRFANAKGVTLRQQDAPRHERRRAQKAREPEPLRFHTLEITPITRVLRDHGHVKTVGIAKALHLCRGHFADYTQGAGLFGKYKVEVFVPEHVRGRAKRGVVVKDYTLPPPEVSDPNA